MAKTRSRIKPGQTRMTRLLEQADMPIRRRSLASKRDLPKEPVVLDNGVSKITFSEALLEEMLAALVISKKRGSEVGFDICQVNKQEPALPGNICDGDRCSVGIHDCHGLGNKVGSYHTHPLQEGETPQERRANQNLMSIGDLYVLLKDHLEDGVRFMCVGNTEWDRVTCYRLKPSPFQTPLKKLRSLRAWSSHLPVTKPEPGLEPDNPSTVMILDHMERNYPHGLPGEDVLEKAMEIPRKRLERAADDTSCYGSLEGGSPGRLHRISRLTKKMYALPCDVVQAWRRDVEQYTQVPEGCPGLADQAQSVRDEADQMARERCQEV